MSVPEIAFYVGPRGDREVDTLAAHIQVALFKELEIEGHSSPTQFRIYESVMAAVGEWAIKLPVIG